MIYIYIYIYSRIFSPNKVERLSVWLVNSFNINVSTMILQCLADQFLETPSRLGMIFRNARNRTRCDCTTAIVTLGSKIVSTVSDRSQHQRFAYKTWSAAAILATTMHLAVLRTSATEQLTGWSRWWRDITHGCFGCGSGSHRREGLGLGDCVAEDRLGGGGGSPTACNVCDGGSGNARKHGVNGLER